MTTERMNIRIMSALELKKIWTELASEDSFLGMDTRFLETFLMVVENGSIAEAARRLNLTSAAVALRLQTLERDIGAHLLFRSGRTVRPTEAGRAILRRARNFLRDMRDLKS